MKKFLLLAAAAAFIAPANAESLSDIFKLSYNGEPLENGQTITVATYYDTTYELKDLIPNYSPSYESQAKIKAENISEEPWELEFTLTRTVPSVSEVPSTGSEYGFYKLCYDYWDGVQNCLNIVNDKVTGPATPKAIDPAQHVILDVDQNDFVTFNPITLQLEIRAVEGGETVASSTVYVNFTHQSDISAGVNTVSVLPQDPEYYTLQGVRVAEPKKGEVYIVVDRSQQTKPYVIIK